MKTNRVLFYWKIFKRKKVANMDIEYNYLDNEDMKSILPLPVLSV